MPTLKIPAPLRPYANGQATISLPGENVTDVLDALVETYPELKKHLYGDDLQLRPFVNLFLGEENINQLQGLKTSLEEGDTLLIIPSIAGG
jgi:molybdopterin converting factor small subunit